MIYTIVVRNSTSSANDIKKIISLNVVTSYSESYTANVLKNPVESGFPIADHITLNNPSFDISGVISEFSIFDNNKELVWNGEEFTLANETTDENPLFKLKGEITNLIKNRELFSILITSNNSLLDNANEKFADLYSTYIDEYFNCCATAISFDNQSGSSGMFNVKISIEKIRVAQTQTVELTQEEQTKALRRNEIDAKTTSVGTATTSEATATDSGGNSADDLPQEDSNLLKMSQEEIAERQQRSNEIATLRVIEKDLERANKESREQERWIKPNW